MSRLIVVLTAAAAMLALLLAGCGGKGEGPGKTEAPEAADQMKAAQAQGMKQAKTGGSGQEKMKQGQAKGAPAGN